MKPDLLSDEEMDRLLADAVSAADPEAERRALAASRRAINRIEPLRCRARAPARRRSKVRVIALLAGWIVAAAALLLAGEIAELLARAGLELAFTSPLLVQAASWFSVSPVVFTAGLLTLLAVTVVALRFALADD